MWSHFVVALFRDLRQSRSLELSFYSKKWASRASKGEKGGEALSLAVVNAIRAGVKTVHTDITHEKDGVGRMGASPGSLWSGMAERAMLFVRCVLDHLCEHRRMLAFLAEPRHMSH